MWLRWSEKKETYFYRLWSFDIDGEVTVCVVEYNVDSKILMNSR